MAVPSIRKQIAREVQRALSEAGLSVAAACRAMPSNPDPKLLYRWLSMDVTAPLDRLEEFALAVGQPITLSVGGQQEQAAPPEWAERLAQGLREQIEATREVVVLAVSHQVGAALGERLEALQQQLLDALAQRDDHPGE